MVALQPCNPCYASLGSATQNESAHCADPRLPCNRGLTWRRYFVTYEVPSERLSSTLVKCRNALFHKACEAFTPLVLFHLFASFSASFGNEFGTGL